MHNIENLQLQHFCFRPAKSIQWAKVVCGLKTALQKRVGESWKGLYPWIKEACFVMHGATLSSVVVLDGSQVYIGVCVHAAHVKKFAASIQNDDSSIATLQEDERNKLRVSVCGCVHVCSIDLSSYMCVYHSVYLSSLGDWRVWGCHRWAKGEENGSQEKDWWPGSSPQFYS